MTTVDRQKRPVLRFEGRTKQTPMGGRIKANLHRLRTVRKNDESALKPSIFAIENQAGERVGAVNSLSASHHIGRQRRPFKEILPYPTFQKRRVCLLCEKQKIGAVLP